MADPHHVDADPDQFFHLDSVPDPTFHCDESGSDFSLMRIWILDLAPHQDDAYLRLLICRPFMAPFGASTSLL
jgi:hypothetical protein